MFGLRVVSKRYKFKTLFGPLFSKLSAYRWIFYEESFFLPLLMADESEYDYKTERYISGPGVDFQKDIITLSEQGWCFSKAAVFSKYAEGVTEDWNGLFGFQKLCFQPLEWTKKYSQVKPISEFVNKTVDVCFLNVDAAYWEIHCRNEAWISLLKTHLCSLPEVEWKCCDISESDGL
jgi:hypothetical protein